MVCLCVGICVWVQVPEEARGGRLILRTESIGYWERPVRVMGNKLRSSTRAASVLNCCTISTAPSLLLYADIPRALTWNSELLVISREHWVLFCFCCCWLFFLFIFMSYFFSPPFFSIAIWKKCISNILLRYSFIFYWYLNFIITFVFILGCLQPSSLGLVYITFIYLYLHLDQDHWEKILFFFYFLCLMWCPGCRLSKC